MSSAIRNNRITLEERNQILAEMSDDVCKMVLRDNLHQNYALMLCESYKFEALDKHIDLMLRLENMKILNRKFEKLPNDQQIDKLKQDKLGLTRPELSVLLAYTKIWLKGEILRTKIPDDKFFENYLVHYFPKRMQDQFREEILSHPLRREIITNFITNVIVNRLGKYFMFSVLEKTGHRIEDVIYGFFVIFSSYKLYNIWHDLEYNHNLEVSAKISALMEIRQFAVSETCALLRSHDSFDILDMVANLSSDISTIIENFEEYNSASSVQKYNQKVNRFLQLGLKQDLAEKISELSFLKNLPSLVELHKQFNVDLKVVTKLNAMVDERLSVKEIREIVSNWRCINSVQETAVQILIDNIGDEHLKIVRHILQESSSGSLSEVESVAKWADEHEVQLANYAKVSEKIYDGSETDYSRIILLINRMGALHKIE
jgi:glutamate dehydrogenase